MSTWDKFFHYSNTPLERLTFGLGVDYQVVLGSISTALSRHHFAMVTFSASQDKENVRYILHNNMDDQSLGEIRVTPAKGGFGTILDIIAPTAEQMELHTTFMYYVLKQVKEDLTQIGEATDYLRRQYD